MKKKKIIFIILCLYSMFLFSCNVKATSSLKCSNVVLGSNIACEVKTDEEVYITSSLSIVSVSGENNSYSGKKATFTSDGIINFNPTSKGKYIIKIANVDESFTNTETVIVSEATKIESSTTTTKKKSGNNLLDKIIVNNEEIDDFSSNKTKYYLTVENDVDSILIDAVASDELSSIDITSPKKLIVGDNEYTISVTAEDNSIKYYKLIITKKDKEVEKSSDTDIKNIIVKKYNLKFDKYSKTFYLNINNKDSSIDIDVTTNDDLAKYEIIGNKKLKDGSIIKIVVTAEDESTDTYRIIIKKEKRDIIPIVIVSSIIFLFVIIIIIVLVNKKKNNSNKKKMKKENDSKNISSKDYNDDKTIEIPSLNNDNKSIIDNSSNLKDNDEEETKMFVYDKDKNDDISKIIDDELEKTLTFDDEF